MSSCDFSDMPYGLGFDRFKLQCGQDPNVEGTTVTVNPTDSQDGGRAEVSALSFRHTYLQDPNSTHPKLLPPPTYKTCITKRLREKNIRSMRLRPRQVLCTRCKQGIHETYVKGNDNFRSEHTTESPLKYEPRKRKWYEGMACNSPMKIKKFDITKTSPVIKISFSSARGEGQTVMKIPAKAQTEEGSEIENSPRQEVELQSNTADIEEEYRKLKKALKRAKLREKSKARDDDGDCNEDSAKHHHKKSKRNKHKMKRKHKHRDLDDPIHHRKHDYVEHSNINVSDFENEGATESGYNDKEPEDKEIKEWDYAKTEPPWLIDNGASLKENSLNVPLKGKVVRGFGGHERNFESSKWSTSSCTSDRSSVYDDNSEYQGSDNDGLQEAPSEDYVAESELKPLMIRIQTRNVTKCITDDGREICIGDIVWGKIHGFPWWPGKIISIAVSQRDKGVIITQMAHVSWFGSSTMSHMPCAELFDFLQVFKARFNKKKRGPYKVAIRQATIAARNLNKGTHVEDLGLDFED